MTEIAKMELTVDWSCTHYILGQEPIKKATISDSAFPLLQLIQYICQGLVLVGGTLYPSTLLPYLFVNLSLGSVFH